MLFRRRSAGLRRPLAATVSAALAVLAAALPLSAPAAAADPAPAADTTVTVNAAAGLGTVGQAALGANTAIWDSHMNDPQVASLYRDAGIGALRYPGGSYADIYHWIDNSAPGGYVAPGTGFDAFMGTVQATGAQPILIANYGSGTAQEAADWVRYANVTKGYGAKYWEIGNEIYGNGVYGSGWENDTHADKTPDQYAREVKAYAAAMKAVDPTVKIGAVLTMPGNWPDGIVAGGDSGDWNHTVLAAVAHDVDFVSVHWYPNAGGGDGALAAVRQLPGELREVRNLLDRYAGADSAKIGIAMTEVNSESGNGALTSRPNGLFAAEAMSTALENGVFTVDWWDTHNGVGPITTVGDETDYGDMGMLSSGACNGSVCEPAVNTPFAPYYGIKALGALSDPGDTMVASAASGPEVSSHAVLRADGDLSVLLLNKNATAARTVDLRYLGFTAGTAAPAVQRWAPGDTGLVDATGTATATSATLAPYSLTVLTVHPAAGTGSAAATVGAPGTPRTTAVDAATATLSWPAATGAVDRYEVYEQLGTTVQLLGSSTGTSATLYNLPPGSRHTVNVLARDQAGHLSRPSVPLTFTTGTPATSTCTVSYQVTSGWGNGFVADVVVNNLGPADLNGWTVDFDWPSTGQSVSSWWNADITSTGQHVRVTNGQYNAHLAPNGGSSAEFGFVGANNGANPSPTVFRLNGTVCRTVS
ncbi:cellulose binding domain-containing protein [Kitasatospora sp. YST-16]|uniref:cellulose binding domain-containing protein n=1 Tax=Kitasatospora sp. YST-16 TaxID=2998080 RepID=UPI002284984E|nr:cellulose binding domain-containing protein [Kitasatospora sp. YST-16]WAL70656.1 cellulose binding domain-containing protein [Kitasatospora sp. YST-16]WNW36698.1 cellulose binding domain-containing protein [Streptomyces sp. Li-HN-5-13]